MVNVPVTPPKCVGAYDLQITRALTSTSRWKNSSFTSRFQRSHSPYVRAPQLKRPYLPRARARSEPAWSEPGCHAADMSAGAWQPCVASGKLRAPMLWAGPHGCVLLLARLH